MRILSTSILLLLLLSAFASAQDGDDDYIYSYFGTMAIFETSERPYDINQTGWWADGLPEKLFYDSSYICGIVNAGRIASGDENLLDPAVTYVEVGYEEELANGYRYSISFRGMRPSEVGMLLDAFGGLEKLMPGATVEYVPLRTASFSYYAYGEQDSLEVTVGELSIEVTMDTAVSEIHERISAMYLETFGREVMVDVYFGQGISPQYGNSLDLSVTVTLVEDSATMEVAPE